MDRAIIEELIRKAADYVCAQIERDGNNRYSLKEAWTLPPVRGVYGPYEDDAFIISPGETGTLITVKPFESSAEEAHCDGCSLSPDRPFGLDFVPGSIVHDRWYEDLEQLAAGLGISEDECRKLGDQIFASVNLAENKGKRGVSTLATIYYWGVRLFGGIYHKSPDAAQKLARKAAKALGIIAIATMLGGCSGCVSSVFEGGDGYESPHYEQVEGE